MADVARSAGVSVPTMSRVLSGSMPVSEDRRKSVEAAVTRLGFRPSAAARFLASRKPEVIAIVTSALLDLGHKTVHHVRVPPSRREDGRTTGWRKALRSRGASIPEVIDASWDPASGREIGRVLAANPTVTAVFCGNDEIAMGAIRGLWDAGLSVPSDVSVAGFDDHPLAAMWIPSITTARQDFEGLGRRGFELLMGALSDSPARTFSSERPTIVLRESTSTPPVMVRR